MKVFSQQVCGVALQMPIPVAWFFRRYDVCRNLVTYGFWFLTLYVAQTPAGVQFRLVWVPFSKQTQAVALSVRPPSLWADFRCWAASERVV